MSRLSALVRITVKYFEAEDRIRLAGETQQGGVVVIWITRRLLDRLLSKLAGILENATAQALGADPVRADAVHRFAQHAAQIAAVPQPPVRPQDEDVQWLARSVDILFAKGEVRLSFRGDDTQLAELDFVEGKLRQFLNILLQMYRTADWPLTAWPTWASSPGRFNESVAHFH
jgi:hypothetical protein